MSLDDFNKQAYGVLTSSKLAEAFDLTKEDPKLVDSYGKGTEKLTADGPWKRLDQFLMARRLVEAGARCVTIGFSRWDWHGSIAGTRIPPSKRLNLAPLYGPEFPPPK